MISGPSSYLGTIDDFLAHWASVDADPQAGTGLVLRTGQARADLLTFRALLETAIDEVADKLNGKELARAQVENGKRALLARAQELGRRMRGVLQVDSPYLAAFPDLPQQSSGQEVFLKPMRDCDNLWTRAVGAGEDIILSGPYPNTSFSNALATLESDFTALHTAASDLKLAREQRNKLQNDVKTLLSGYRPAVEGLFTPDSPLVASIPSLYDAGGRTPDPVAASASYDAATQEAVITFTASADEALARYELRGVPGPEYDGDDESVIATLAAGAPREFRTGFSLGMPGMAASFKVYVVLTTGHEAGSEAVTVERES